MAQKIDTENTQAVSFRQDYGVFVLAPLPMRTRQDVFRHVAWLMMLSETLPDHTEQRDTNGDPYTLDAYYVAVANT